MNCKWKKIAKKEYARSKKYLFGMEEERQGRAVVLKPGCTNEFIGELLIKIQISGLFPRLLKIFYFFN